MIVWTPSNWRIKMKWKIAQLEDKQQQQLDCWDLGTQAEIVQCMREI